MKEIIVDYFEQNGFRIIKDENEYKRFFHIQNVRQRDRFLNNITDYYYTDWKERKCNIVNFNPGQNVKGLQALHITLTTHIFIDCNILVEARVTNVKYVINSLTKVATGICKGKSAPFGATAGRSGTYRI